MKRLSLLIDERDWFALATLAEQHECSIAEVVVQAAKEARRPKPAPVETVDRRSTEASRLGPKDVEQFINHHRSGLSDTEISRLMTMSSEQARRFRIALELPSVGRRGRPSTREAA